MGASIGWVSMMLGHEDEETTRTDYYKWIRLVDDNPVATEEGDAAIGVSQLEPR